MQNHRSTKKGHRITMRIEQIDHRTIKVILTASDLDRLDITYEEMDYKDPNTKRVILELLHHVRKETDVDLQGGRLLVEAFPGIGGGCVLYICAISEEKGISRTPAAAKGGFNTPLVFGFSNLEQLTSACKQMVLQLHHIILKSALYRYQSEYRLLIYSYFKSDDRLIGLVCEYGRYLGKGSLPASVVKEHATCLLESNAVEVITETLA